MAGAEFHNVSLAGARFYDVSMTGAKFENINMTGVEITRCQHDGDEDKWRAGGRSIRGLQCSIDFAVTSS